MLGKCSGSRAATCYRKGDGRRFPSRAGDAQNQFTMSTERDEHRSAPLRIAVLGAGKIGSTFAFYLARNGHHHVTAIARRDSVRLEQLRLEGGIVSSKGERADVCVADMVDQDTPYDLVIVTLLDHQVDAVLPDLRRSAARHVLFMFNTFNPERLRDAMGAERCSFGMPFVQATIDGNGRLHAKVGAAGQKSKLNQQGCVSVFVSAGLPAVLETDMLLWLRCHVPLCVAFESVSVAGVRRGGGASWGESMVLARGVQESFALIQSLGYRLYPSGKRLLSTAPAWAVASMLWTMSRIPSFRELLATGIGECRALVDDLVAHAVQAGAHVSTARIEAMKPSKGV